LREWTAAATLSIHTAKRRWGNMSAPIDQPKPKNWWQRLWSPEPTISQSIFDFIFGVVAPLLCLYFDPGVFRSGDPCFGPLLGWAAPFVYLAIGLGVSLLTFWLIANHWIVRGRSLFVGVFLGGAIFAFITGLVLIPFSLFGIIIYGLGCLGFIPFLVAIVYWRNAHMALSGEGITNPWIRLTLAVLGLALVFALPGLTARYAPNIVSWAVVENREPCPTYND
jgi:hypothetical protein